MTLPSSESAPIESHYFEAPMSYRDKKRIRRIRPTTRCLRCRVAHKDHAIIAAAIIAVDCEREGRW